MIFDPYKQELKWAAFFALGFAALATWQRIPVVANLSAITFVLSVLALLFGTSPKEEPAPETAKNCEAHGCEFIE